jgi:orotidine-5'-phosphate decarboxylase
MSAEIIVALDFADADAAIEFVELIEEDCDFYKVGLELFTSGGPAIVDMLRARGKGVFLDQKFHDIPNTVRGAARNAARLGAEIITVHLSGGPAMLDAALEGADEGAEESGVDCKVFGVSVLTSLDAATLADVWGRSQALDGREEVKRLATMAADCGLHGLVCSGHEVRAVREALGGQLEILVPGLRLEPGDSQDQARVMTPYEARREGADYLVLGRAVTLATDPQAVLAGVRAGLAVVG